MFFYLPLTRPQVPDHLSSLLAQATLTKCDEREGHISLLLTKAKGCLSRSSPSYQGLEATLVRNTDRVAGSLYPRTKLNGQMLTRGGNGSLEGGLWWCDVRFYTDQYF